MNQLAEKKDGRGLLKTTVNDRIRELIYSFRLNNTSFARSVGKVPTTINYIVDGKTKPGFELITAILAAYPTISPDWLLLGQGKMTRPKKGDREVTNNERADQLREELQFMSEQVRLLSLTLNQLLGKYRGMLRSQLGFITNWGVPCKLFATGCY